MPKVVVNGVDHHYVTAGEGPEVVMLHGFLGNLAVWHLQIVPQMRRNYRLVTYDLRGHGYSAVTPDGYTPSQLAEDLRILLDELAIRKPVLVGHSFGADICMYFAYKYPSMVSKLVAIEPGLAALVHQRKDKDWVGWTYWVKKLEEVGITVPEDKRSDFEYLLALSLETKKFYGPARGLPRNREPLLNLIHNTTLIRDYEDVGELTLDAIGRIDTETLLVYGEHSHFLSTFEFLRRTLRNCRSIVLPGGEHFGPLEQPDLLVRHMTEFFEGQAVLTAANGEVHHA